MTKEEILAKLDLDEHYYGEFGQQWLSSSDIGALLDEDPLRFKARSSEPKLAFVQGGYFHTACLEPHKLHRYKIIDATTRATKKYKEEANGELCLLTKDVAKIQKWQDAVMAEAGEFLEGNVEFEQPGYTMIENLPFKGKADIIHHDKKLVVDLKTTASAWEFESKVLQWNYDSQAYIYEQLFGYDFAWVAVDKRDQTVRVVYNNDTYRASGREKVQRASEVYKDWFGLNK